MWTAPFAFLLLFEFRQAVFSIFLVLRSVLTLIFAFVLLVVKACQPAFRVVYLNRFYTPCCVGTT
jgi:hypothetical protein